MNKHFLTGVALCVGLLASPAMAASVTDGFEDGTLAPWYQANDFGGSTDWQVTTNDAHTGAFSAYDVGNKELRLNFSGINVSDISSASFWMKHPTQGNLPAYVTTFYSDSSENGRIYTTSGTDWEQFSFTDILVGGKTLTGFSIYGYSGGTNPNSTFFDDFSINAAGVPEPATWALMIGGFAAVGYAMRRKTAVATRFA